jgi:predicted enzyme related to lactoylglutathione lyase
MPQAPQWTFGRFVWHELVTPDMARSQAFYAELLGWQYQSFPGGAPYQMILAGGLPQAGMLAPGGGGPDAGPGQVMGYVSTPDLDAAARAAASAGGEVLVPPLEVPGVGRLAVLADPGGASFSLLRSAGGDAPERPQPAAGEFCWDELVCAEGDLDRTRRFYVAVLGWTLRPADGPVPAAFESDGRPRAALTADPQAVSSHWRSYVAVEALPGARDRVQRLGGRVLVPQCRVGARGVGAIIEDCTGTPLGLVARSAGTPG